MAQSVPDQLTSEMLRKELYVVTTKPARSPEIQEMLPQHLDYQVSLEREGKLFGAGPIWDESGDIPVGGMIILYAETFEQAREIAENDPLHKNGLRQFTIRKWMLNEGSVTFTVRYSDRSVVF